MDKKLLNLAFSEVKSETSLDFAIPEVSKFGSNSTEVRQALADTFGKDAKGIWARRWINTTTDQEDVIYVMPFNLTVATMKDVMHAFSVLGYYVVPCTGNCNTNGFFSLEEIPAEKRLQKFFVRTPLGFMKIHSKRCDYAYEYPGVYVDLITDDGQDISLACVEYDTDSADIAIDSFPDAEASWNVNRIHVENLPGMQLAIAKKHIMSFLEDYEEDKLFADLHKIPLAWTEIEYSNQLSVQVYADLVDCKLTTCIVTPEKEEVIVDVIHYNDLEAMNDEELEMLDFDTLIHLSDANWAVFSKSKAGRKWLKENYPTGTRVQLTAQVVAPLHIPNGTCGVVTGIDGLGRLTAKMDSGDEILLFYGEDSFEIIKEV